MRKIIDNNVYSFVIFLLITPILVMISNLFRFDNLSYVLWYLPNFLFLTIGIYFLLFDFKIKKNYIFSLLLIISILSFVFSGNKKTAFFGRMYEAEGLIIYIGYIGFFYIGTKLKNKELNKKILNLFLIVASLIAFLSLIRIDMTYRLFFQPKDLPYYYYQGPFSHFNHFGLYLLFASICSTMMFIFNKGKNKLIYLIIHIILLYTLVINDTFGVYLAYLFALICLLIYYIIKKSNIKEILTLLAVFIFISGVTYRSDYNFHIVSRNFKELFHDTSDIVSSNNVEDIYKVGTSRGQLWVNATKCILKKPILGYGFDVYTDDFIDGLGGPHNLILEQAICIGVVGMLLYFSLIISIMWKNIRGIKHIDNSHLLGLVFIISYLAYMMFGNSTYYLAPYFYLFLGILYSDNIKKVLVKKNEV